MKHIGLDYSHGLIQPDELGYYRDSIKHIHEMLHGDTPGDPYLGWLKYPVQYNRQEFERVKGVAARIRQDSQAFVVIGIGGSYNGARAAIEMLGHTFHNVLPAIKRSSPEIYFAGNNISGRYYKDLLDALEGKDVSLCVISKSGTTTEPAIAFRLLREYLERKYGEEEACRRIVAITDKEKGVLRKIAGEKGYEAFDIPGDIGGRYSVLTPVGMLPAAVAGINIDRVMDGAKAAYYRYEDDGLDSNQCYRYAVIRNILQQKGKCIEVLVSCEPSFKHFAEWWKQLFGESEGKDGKGIFPASVEFTTDLHSLGQLLQDGRRNMFETVLNIEKPRADAEIARDPEDIDGLNFISGQTMHSINQKAIEGTLLAHSDGGVPCLVINIPEISEYYFGELVYFFEKACAVSGYLSGVNPFNQPGVEEYKKNMLALLGKPGYEELGESLRKRLKRKDVSE